MLDRSLGLTTVAVHVTAAGGDGVTEIGSVSLSITGIATIITNITSTFSRVGSVFHRERSVLERKFNKPCVTLTAANPTVRSFGVVTTPPGAVPGTEGS